jgi:secreted trypsin-like serine protease
LQHTKCLSPLLAAFLFLPLMISCKRSVTDSDPQMSEGIVARGNEEFLPYIVSLRMPVDETTAGYCTGVLVGARHVLTAAHCIDDAKSIQVVRYGKQFMNTKQNAVAWKIHPDFPTSPRKSLGAEGSAVDIGVVLLEKSFPPPYARLPAASKQNHDNAMYVGVGTSEGEKFDLKVRYGKGIQAHRVDVRPLGAIWRSRGQAKLCTGDSGGPLFSSSGEVLGVASTSVGRIRSNRCGVSDAAHHADVKTHLKWVACVGKGWAVPFSGLEKVDCTR